jgi:hypothetical protein
MGRLSAHGFAVLLLVVLSACNGDPPSSPPPPSPPTTPTPTPPVANPCTTAAAQDEAPAETDANRTTTATAPGDLAKGRAGLGADERPVSDLLWNHVLRRQPAAAADDAAVATPAVTADVGHIAVIEDDGTLLLRQNAFDLRQRGLRFEPNAGGGYDVVDVDAAFRQTLGRRLTLQDDDAAQEALPFAVSFYGQSFSSVFVNSDGNLTFEAADTASTTRGFVRLLGGPPRVAPFFSDLDPTTGNGRLFVQAGADDFTVTWCGVRGFEETRSVTAQVSLFRGGAIEMRFADVDLLDAIVALSPGRNGAFTPIDLSTSGRRAGGAAAVGERFAEAAELDLVAVARRFYASHKDDFDQLVVWTDTTVVTDAFAFESTVANAIRGIGQDLFDSSRDFGSGSGVLSSMLVMDRVAKYPDDPTRLILGESSALAVLAHETGHRWLARLLFRGDNGAPSDVLLGRQRAHWSFFMDSDASVMEGNEIEDLRGGAFRTIAAGQRYSRLDLYAMGLASVAEVPPFFYVDQAVNVNPERDRESAPRVGVTLNGTRRDVLIQDVVDALGPRQPTSAESPRLHRQAYLFIVGRGVTASSGDIARIDRIRRDFEGFFRQATENRMSVRTTLQ